MELPTKSRERKTDNYNTRNKDTLRNMEHGARNEEWIGGDAVGGGKRDISVIPTTELPTHIQYVLEFCAMWITAYVPHWPKANGGRLLATDGS